MIYVDELLAIGSATSTLGIREMFTDWCFDSRLAQPGQCFVALPTERRDGHAFVADAVARGCTGVLCSTPPVHALNATVIVVTDTRLALQQWAAQRLRTVRPQVVAVTGSVGKTTTKRAIATLLAAVGPTFRSRRSFNSLLGLPLALADLQPGTRWAVLEMGVDRFGEMAQLAALFPPQIAVVTAIAPTHLHYLRDEAHIAAEKGALVAALPLHGHAVLNADDLRVAALAARTAANIVWHGCDAERVRAAHSERPGALPPFVAHEIVVALDGTRFVVEHAGQRLPAWMPLVGQHNVSAALAALAVGCIAGLTFATAAARLSLLEAQAGRLRPLPGLGGSTLLDDSYNASPAAMLAALATLQAVAAQRRIAVLGPMLELGASSAAWQRTITATAARSADLVVSIGDGDEGTIHGLTRIDTDGAGDTDGARTVATTHDAIHLLRPLLRPGDVVLVKGSAAARMEQVVAGLLAPGIQPADVLVRQEALWETLRFGPADRPTWLEIDLGAVRGNLNAIRALVGPTVQIMAVLKADGYGHGALPIARTALHHGATFLAVATLGEAVALRAGGITAPILLLGYTPPWQVRDAMRHDVQVTVFDAGVAEELARAAAELQLPARVHVKVDTGMGRLGLAPAAVPSFLRRLHALPGVEVVGLFTHFATADSADPSFTLQQIALFDALLGELTAAGLRPPLVHAANGAATLRYPQAHYDLVRPGLLLYGLDPAAETPAPPAFTPVLSWKTEVAQVKTLAVGASVSYGATWVAQRPSQIATIPVGYADGFRRTPHWAAVLVHGQRVPIAGRVCMDYTMLDVTDVPGVRPGDEVVLIGTQGAAAISAEEVAVWLDTIPYEVVAGILPRVPRVIG